MPPTIPTTIRISKRAQNITLRVKPYPLQAELVIPHGVSQKKALLFLESKREWIAEKASHFPSPFPLLPGSVIPLLGKDTTLRHTGSIRGLPRFEEDILWISGPETHAERRIKTAIKNALHTEIIRQADLYAAQLERPYRKIALRETSSRWGSCSSQGNLSFSWKLVFAPLPVLHYVIAHEVAHLVEMNHSLRFWHLVACLCPDYAKQRQWLKKHGMGLHRYG